MEHLSGKERVEGREHEPPFEKQLALARGLFTAIETRDAFVKKQGDFDAFAEGEYYSAQTGGDEYDALEKAVQKAQKAFDDAVFYKEIFLDKLKKMGEQALADVIFNSFKAL